MHVLPLYHLLTMTDVQKKLVIELGPDYRLAGVEDDGRLNMFSYNSSEKDGAATVHIWPDGKIEYYDVFGRQLDAEGNRI